MERQSLMSIGAGPCRWCVSVSFLETPVLAGKPLTHHLMGRVA